MNSGVGPVMLEAIRGGRAGREILPIGMEVLGRRRMNCSLELMKRWR
jgi:hypothetical protein